MSNGVRDVVIITGITGYGKSHWLEQYLNRYSRVFIFDPFRAIPANYISGDDLISKYENGDLNNPNPFRFGCYALPDVALMGSIGYLVGNCAFVIEECGYAFRKGESIPEWLAEGIFLGRHQSYSMVFTAQRAISIPIELRSQTNRFISFRQTEPADVKWCREKLGEFAEDLPTLPKYYCFDSDGDTVSRYSLSGPPKPDNEVATNTTPEEN